MTIPSQLSHSSQGQSWHLKLLPVVSFALSRFFLNQSQSSVVFSLCFSFCHFSIKFSLGCVSIEVSREPFGARCSPPWPHAAPGCQSQPSQPVQLFLNHARVQWTKSPNAVSSSSPMEPSLERGLLLGNQAPTPTEPKAAGKGSKHSALGLREALLTQLVRSLPARVFCDHQHMWPSVTAHTTPLKFRTAVSRSRSQVASRLSFQ